MTATFDSLKKNRSKSLDKLTEQLKKLDSKPSYSDPEADTYWKPTRDSAGNGFAIIRFLPAPAGEDMPFVKLWDHGFQGPTGQWYIENSLSTLNQPDPLGDLNRKLWNSGNDEDKKQAQKQKRRLHYISNIYVIKDSGNPENDGKVFRFKFGKKIYDKLNDMMVPAFEDETPVNPFDLWEGANFRLKIRMFEGYPNYDKSEFDSPSPLFEEDDKMEAIWKKEYSLTEVIDPKNFKSYEELQAKLHKVLGMEGTSSPTKTVSSKPSRAEDEESDELDMSKFGSTKSATPIKEESSSSSDDDDDDLEYFKNLVKS